MRTPSIYSQDDPLSSVLKPPPSETDVERKARLQGEAEAKRISEKIDEDLRLERERLRRSKGDVKVRPSTGLSYCGAHILTLTFVAIASLTRTR